MTDPLVIAHEHPWPGQVLRRADALNSYTQHDERRVADIDEANIVTSEIAEFAGMHIHRPVLDIDFMAKLIPSSTPGHFHLYLDRPLGWEPYKKLLLALAEAGIIEGGYATASIERGYSAVRLPWITKQN